MVDELCRVLANQHDCAPVREPTHKANLVSAEDSKLEQNCNGSGGGGANGNGRRCWDCESPDHMCGDPKCPNPEERRGRKPKITHGLDVATSLKVSALAKEKENAMPKKEHIPDPNAQLRLMERQEHNSVAIADSLSREPACMGLKQTKECLIFVPALLLRLMEPLRWPRHMPQAPLLLLLPPKSPWCLSHRPLSFLKNSRFLSLTPKSFMTRSANCDFSGVPHVGANIANVISNLEAKQERHNQGLDQVEDPEEAAFLAMLAKENGGQDHLCQSC